MIAAAQLMVVLDGTITNIALPSVQTDLNVSASNLAWIVNSYALAFGGLLLLGRVRLRRASCGAGRRWPGSCRKWCAAEYLLPRRSVWIAGAGHRFGVLVIGLVG